MQKTNRQCNAMQTVQVISKSYKFKIGKSGTILKLLGKLCDEKIRVVSG